MTSGNILTGNRCPIKPSGSPKGEQNKKISTKHLTLDVEGGGSKFIRTEIQKRKVLFELINFVQLK